METFVRSDLAIESGALDEGSGVRVTEGEGGGCRILRVQIKTPEAAARIGKPEGQYVTVDCGALCALDERELERVSRAVGVELRSMAERVCGKRITSEFSVLVVGLGNRSVTPDSVGPETVCRLSVTRHLKSMESAVLAAGGLCRISAVEPGVPAVTGLETAETVEGIVRVTAPDLVLAVDALTARSADRLGNTVQLSSGGIRPASGVERGHCALDRESLGVPVLSLGVPTAVGSDTLAYDLLQRAGISDLRDLRALLERGRGFLVTTSGIDLLVRCAGILLADAIERAFSVL